MYKVYIEFMDGIREEFYANSDFGSVYPELMVVYWELENGDRVSYPVDNIRKFVEREVD